MDPFRQPGQGVSKTLAASIPVLGECGGSRAFPKGNCCSHQTVQETSATPRELEIGLGLRIQKTSREIEFGAT